MNTKRSKCSWLLPPLLILAACGCRAGGEAPTRRALVFLRDAVELGETIETMTARTGRSERRSRITRLLRTNAARARADLLRDLGGPGMASSRNLRTSWLANAVFLDVTDHELEALRKRPDVRRVELDREVRLTPPELHAGDGVDENGVTWGLKAIRALEARASHQVDGSGVVVGILDTGYDPEHPELAGRLRAWKDLTKGRPEAYDDHGHGTHCAGSIGGSGVEKQIGVAPGVDFVAGKIFTGAGTGRTEWILAAMQWIVDPDGVPGSGDEPRIVSNSWGGGPGETTYQEVIRSWLALGILPVFAAGNEGPGPSTVGSPGGLLEAFAVGASTVREKIAGFSSRGPVRWHGKLHTKPDVAAPGAWVLSARAGGGYQIMSGTSMATPHVAGLAALLVQADPGLTAGPLRDILERSAHERGEPGKDQSWGWGRIDCMDALALVRDGGRLTGRVLDPEGRPVPGARVGVSPRPPALAVDDSGRYELRLPPGEAAVSAEAFGYGTATLPGLEVRSGETTVADLSLAPSPTGTLRGRLRAGEAPVTGRVVLRDVPVAPVEVPEDGQFSRVLPAGTYDLVVRSPGLETRTVPGVEVRPDQETEVSLDLAPLPPVLVVDDDEYKDYERYYLQALEDLGIDHHLVAHDEVLTRWTAGDLAPYEVVIWFTGNDYRRTLVPSDRELLSAYLDQGGRLLLTGQDIGYHLKDTAFYRDRLKARFVGDVSASTAIQGAGIVFSINGGDGARNQRHPDRIEALDVPDVRVAYRYMKRGPAGLEVASGESRIVYLAFGFEGISVRDNRRRVMASVLQFLTR